jgi:hypothetical protein
MWDFFDRGMTMFLLYGMYLWWGETKLSWIKISIYFDKNMIKEIRRSITSVIYVLYCRKCVFVFFRSLLNGRIESEIRYRRRETQITYISIQSKFPSYPFR